MKQSASDHQSILQSSCTCQDLQAESHICLHLLV
ncbi:MAG: SWIM zinc finger family protein [Bulleidia sp.]